MMKTQGSFTFAAPPTDIWPFLVNPQTLSQIIPGCQDISAQANGAYLAKLHIRVGPLAGEYAVTLQPTRSRANGISQIVVTVSA